MVEVNPKKSFGSPRLMEVRPFSKKPKGAGLASFARVLRNFKKLRASRRKTLGVFKGGEGVKVKDTCISRGAVLKNNEGPNRHDKKNSPGIKTAT